MHAANSRYALGNPAGIPSDAGELLLQHAPQASSLAAVEEALAGTGTRIVIDATATRSGGGAARRTGWRGASTWSPPASWGRARRCRAGRPSRPRAAAGGAQYGDSATVGAGLPLLRSLRALQAGGDRIHAIAGVLSGSLAWLFNQYDGKQPFSGFVRAGA